MSPHDVHLAQMAAYLFERYRPTLLLVHVEGVVQIQQEPDWRNPRRVRAIACADLVVSLLVELIERTDAWPHTTLIVTGDSGMAEVHTQVRPNAWLIDAGLRPRVLDGSGDWRATFHAIGGCAFLRVQPPADENAAAARQVLARVRRTRDVPHRRPRRTRCARQRPGGAVCARRRTGLRHRSPREGSIGATARAGPTQLSCAFLPTATREIARSSMGAAFRDPRHTTGAGRAPLASFM